MLGCHAISLGTVSELFQHPAHARHDYTIDYVSVHAPPNALKLANANSDHQSHCQLGTALSFRGSRGNRDFGALYELVPRPCTCRARQQAVKVAETAD